MSKEQADSFVRKWIKQEEAEISSRNARRALFGETKKQSISMEDMAKINAEIDRLVNLESRSDAKNRKSTQDIKQEVYSKYRNGDL